MLKMTRPAATGKSRPPMKLFDYFFKKADKEEKSLTPCEAMHALWAITLGRYCGEGADSIKQACELYDCKRCFYWDDYHFEVDIGDNYLTGRYLPWGVGRHKNAVPLQAHKDCVGPAIDGGTKLCEFPRYVLKDESELERSQQDDMSFYSTFYGEYKKVEERIARYFDTSRMVKGQGAICMALTRKAGKQDKGYKEGIQIPFTLTDEGDRGLAG